MAFLNPDEVLNAFASNISSRFPDVSLDFYKMNFTRMTGLEVRAPRKNVKEIQDYCKRLQKHPPEPNVPIKIVVKAA